MVAAGFKFWHGQEMFCPKHHDWLWGSPNNLSIAYPGSFPRVWVLRHEADHLWLSTAEVKTQGIHTFSGIRVFMESRGTTLLLTNILDEVKEDQMGRACCTHGRGEEKCRQSLGWKAWRKETVWKTLGLVRRRMLKVNLQVTGPEVVDWSHLAQIRVKWLALVSKVMGLWFPFLD